MVAYSFQKRFKSDVAQLIKRQTIRGQRKRHARVGEAIQLYYAMRTKHCKKLVDPDPVCTHVIPIKISVPEGDGLAMILGLGEPFLVTNVFARADGFKGPKDFTRFWRDAHGPGLFDGVLIKWDIAT